jgi:hypothetical protein
MFCVWRLEQAVRLTQAAEQHLLCINKKIRLVIHCYLQPAGQLPAVPFLMEVHLGHLAFLGLLLANLAALPVLTSLYLEAHF